MAIIKKSFAIGIPLAMQNMMFSIQIISMFFVISGFTNVFRASLNGVGDSSFTMYNGILEIAVCVILLFSLTKVSFIGMWGVWCTSGLSCMIAGIVCFYRYANGKWKKKIIII